MPKTKEFISSSEDSDSEQEAKSKKRKLEKKKAEKKEEKPKASASKSNAAGEQMFQLARMRYVTVSEFRGKTMVSIREYYEADGDLRPGKKGITLNVEQWNRLKDQIDEIDEAVKQLS